MCVSPFYFLFVCDIILTYFGSFVNMLFEYLRIFNKCTNFIQIVYFLFPEFYLFVAKMCTFCYIFRVFNNLFILFMISHPKANESYPSPSLKRKFIFRKAEKYPRPYTKKHRESKENQVESIILQYYYNIIITT